MDQPVFRTGISLISSVHKQSDLFQDPVVGIEQLNLDLFVDKTRWPLKPFCSDDKTARHIRSLSAALTRPYIQANPPHLRVWSIYDVDRPGAALEWETAQLPPPAWAAVDRISTKAHLVWGLSAPVLVDSPDMRQAPMRYLCAVEAAFRERLQADQGYAGLMTKNPSHPLWRTLRGPQLSYELGELAKWVDLPKHIPKRNPDQIGLGRNVTIFEFLRQYAYRQIRHYKMDVRNYIHWQAHLNNRALERNGDLQNPLDGREIWHIAKSVSKWTWQKFDIAASDAKFSKLQTHRGQQGGIAKGMANESRRATVHLMIAQGMSIRAIAESLGVAKSTVGDWVATSINQVSG